MEEIPTPKRTRAKKTDRHYVDNKLFYTVMLKYKHEYDDAKANDTALPKIPSYVGECLYKIATRLSMKPNFINYTFRDEMISDGLENCITYLHNFDPEKSQKTLENFYFEGMLAEQSVNDDDHAIGVNLDNEYMQNLVASYDKKRAENQQKAKEKKNLAELEKFLNDDREQDASDPASDH